MNTNTEDKLSTRQKSVNEKLARLEQSISEIFDQPDQGFSPNISELLDGVREAQDMLNAWNREITRLENSRKQVSFTLNRIQRLSQVGSWEWNIPENKVFWSDELYHVLGVEKASHPVIDLEMFLSCIHPEDRQRVQDIINGSSKSCDFFEFYHRIDHPDKGIRLLYCRGDVICDGQDNAYKMLGTCRDVTEEKNFEEKLRKNEVQYSELFQGTNAGIVIHDKEGNILDMNNKAFSLFGVDKSNLGKILIQDLFSDHSKHMIPYLKEELERDGYVYFEAYFITKNKRQIFPGELTGSLIRFDGQEIIQCHIRDISAKKDSEEKWRTLVENTPDVIARFDRNLRYIFINSAVKKELGLNPSDYLGKTIMETGVPAEVSKPWMEKLRKVFHTEKEHYHQIKMKSPYGLKYFSVRMVPEFAPNGKLKSVLTISRDVTKAKLAENALKQAHDQLERRVEERTRELKETNEDLQKEIRTRKKLEDKQIRLAAMVESSEDGMIGLEMDGTILSWNKGAEKTFGFTEKEVISKHLKDVLPSEDPDEINRMLEKLKNGETITHYESKRKRKDLQMIDLSISISPITMDSGKLIGATFSARDITEKKLTERENERLSLVLSKTNNSVFITNEEGRVKWVNDGFIRLTGYTQEEVLGTMGEMLRNKEVAGFVPGTIHYDTVIKEKKAVSYEVKNYSKSGQIYWVLTTLTPILDDNNEIQEIIGIDSDITRRKTVENELRSITGRLFTLIDNLLIGVLFENHENEIVNVNKTFCSMFNLGEKPADLVGSNCMDLKLKMQDLVHENQRYLRKIRRLSANKNTIHRDELKMKDGRIIERCYIPVSSNGDFSGHLWLYSDVTKQRNSKLELLKAKRFAEHSAKAKEQFMANMSHEIRTPMNAIIGMSQLLSETELNPEQKRFLKTIHFASENLLFLINDILDIAKIDSGKIEFENIDFYLRDLINSLIDTHAFKAGEKGLRLSSTIDEKIPQKICGDQMRLNQILTNLLSNAIKFTDEGDVELTVKSKSQSDRSVNLEFCVRDTGIGIPTDKQSKVFESFVQVDSETSRKYGGTGLGLSIVKQLVELQGGQIILESKEGQGSTFCFSLSFDVAEQKEEGKDKQVPLKDETAGDARILIVEDNLLNQMLLKKFLSKWGFSAKTAKNGLDALKILQVEDFDLILMDIQMPEMDGYEATKKIRQEFEGEKKHVPILAMTAHAFKSEREKCLRTGMDEYVSKPIKPDKLYNMVRKLLLKK